VVLLKALEVRGVLESMNGRIAIEWLVVEDLATVLVLVLLPSLASVLGGAVVASAEARPLWVTIAQTLLQVSAFIALMLIIGPRAALAIVAGIAHGFTRTVYPGRDRKSDWYRLWCVGLVQRIVCAWCILRRLGDE
jgi:predicted Kef-type K+ transport protein